MTPLGWHQIALPVVMCMVLAVVAGRVPRYRFALMGLVVLVGYAMLQDQVSARLCPEYFTVLHPPIPGLTDPTLLGISWGFLGAWWGGVLPRLRRQAESQHSAAAPLHLRPARTFPCARSSSLLVCSRRSRR